MMKKKVLAWLLLGSIIFTNLTGCGRPRPAGSPATDSAWAATEETAPAAADGESLDTWPAAGGQNQTESNAGSSDVPAVEEYEPAEPAAEAAAEEYAAEAPAAEPYTPADTAAAPGYAPATDSNDQYSQRSYADTAEKQRESQTDGGYLDSIYDYDTNGGNTPNTEEYSDLTEIGFSSVLEEPLSTFSADVDTASYSNLRRLIKEGYDLRDLPDGSVRIEEMLNYFSYHHNEPQRNEPFGVTTEISACPWNSSTELLMVGLKTEAIDYDNAPAANLVFLLDVSGSMNESDKLPLLQESFAMLTENLNDKDRVSIVTYAGSDQIVLDGVKGSRRETITDALYSLDAGGGTNGSQGIITAYKLAEEHFIKGGNNRVILATDGDLNIGLTTEGELEELIGEKRKSGVFLSVLGFGTGNLKDNKMETLADKGNGSYAYIDSVRESRKVLVQEMGATLLTVCKDVKFQVEFNPAVVKAYRLIGYENRRMNREDFRDDAKDAGEIGAGHSVTALYEIRLHEPMRRAEAESEDRVAGNGDPFLPLKYAENHPEDQTDIQAWRQEEWLTVNIRYKKPAASASSLLSYPVDRSSYRYGHVGEDWRFAAAVAEFGLIAAHSENKGTASIDHVRLALRPLVSNDEYKTEFYELVEQIAANTD